MTDIKKLQQNGKEFVPITLAEAVVVNATNITKLLCERKKTQR